MSFERNSVLFSETNYIKVEQMDVLTASNSFIHVDRIAQMNVLIFVLSGCIYVSEEDKDYEVKPGELILLKKGSHQFGKHMIKSGTSWIYAHFQIVGERDDTSVIELPKYVSLENENDINKRLINLCKPIQEESSLPNNRRSIALQEILLDIYEGSKSHKQTGVTREIKKFLGEKIFENVSSGMLEKKFNLTYKYINRLFKEEYGESIKQYHTRQRMSEAARELRSTDDSITDICRKYGYDDLLYFSKVFKKEYGISPRAYRNNIISEAFR